MNLSRILFLSLTLGSLNGCTIMAVGVVGTTPKSINELSYVSETPKDILLEFKVDSPSSNTKMVVRKKVDKNEFFRVPERYIHTWKLSKGPFKSKPSAPSACLSTERVSPGVIVRDNCTHRETKLLFAGGYTFKSPWRLVLLPIILPFTIAGDIIMMPWYLGVLAKCTFFGCKI